MPEKGDTFTANCIYISLYAQSLLEVEVLTNFAFRAKPKPISKLSDELEMHKKCDE